MSTNSGKFERRRIRSYGVRRPNRNRASSITDRGGAASVPRDFFCPISKKFMADPVTIRNSHLTYDRKSVEHLHKAPEDVLPDLRMRKRMDAWFSQHKIDPAFDSINSLGFFMGSVISVAKKREESLLREFVTVTKGRPLHYLAKGWGMWCVATLLSCDPPSGKWVATALSLASYVYTDVHLLAPEGIDPGIHPNYSLLRPINDVLKEQPQLTHDRDFKNGLITFMYALVMNSPDISAMEGKMEEIVAFLAKKLWSDSQIFHFGLYLRQFLTLERLCQSVKFRESISETEVIRTLLDPMNSAILILENINNFGSLVRLSAPETIGTGMRILEILCQNSKKARVQLREIIMRGANLLFPTLFHHMKIVGDYVEVSEVFAAHFSAEPETPVRINVHLEPHEMPVPVENEYDDIENEIDDNESDDSENENDDSEIHNDD